MERWGHTPRDGGVSDALEKSYSPAVLLIDRKSTRSSDEVKSAKQKLVPPNLPPFAELCRAADDKRYCFCVIQQTESTYCTTTYHCLHGLSELQSAPA